MSWDETCFMCGVCFCLLCSYLSIAVDSVMGMDWGKNNAVYIRIGVCLSLFDHQEYKMLGLSFL